MYILLNGAMKQVALQSSYTLNEVRPKNYKNRKEQNKVEW